jgi:hypothetical protein
MINNSYQDCLIVAESGLLNNVIACCRDLVAKVRKEAMYCLTGLLKQLKENKEHRKIVKLTLDYEIELLLHQIIGDTRSNENDMITLALHCY